MFIKYSKDTKANCVETYPSDSIGIRIGHGADAEEDEEKRLR